MAPPAYEPPVTGTYTRTATTIVHLKSNVPRWPKPKCFVVVTSTATDKTDGSDLYPAGIGYGLGEPVEGDGGTPINPASTPITVAGKQCNADGEVFLEINKVSEQDVTPQIGVNWYSYGLTATRPKAVTLTWSRHACVSQPASLQTKFDEGAQLLATDNDGSGDHSDTDDVSCYLEFFIPRARKNVFPPPYSDASSDETRRDDLEFLAYGDSANVKLVTRIGYWEDSIYKEPIGCALLFDPGIVLVNSAVSGELTVHEYGHTAGLPDVGRPEAIMCGEGTGTCEVNIAEWCAYSMFTPAVWNN